MATNQNKIADDGWVDYVQPAKTAHTTKPAKTTKPATNDEGWVDYVQPVETSLQPDLTETDPAQTGANHISAGKRVLGWIKGKTDTPEKRYENVYKPAAEIAGQTIPPLALAIATKGRSLLPTAAKVAFSAAGAGLGLGAVREGFRKYEGAPETQMIEAGKRVLGNVTEGASQEVLGLGLAKAGGKLASLVRAGRNAPPVTTPLSYGEEMDSTPARIGERLLEGVGAMKEEGKRGLKILQDQYQNLKDRFAPAEDIEAVGRKIKEVVGETVGAQEKDVAEKLAATRIGAGGGKTLPEKGTVGQGIKGELGILSKASAHRRGAAFHVENLGIDPTKKMKLSNYEAYAKEQLEKELGQPHGSQDTSAITKWFGIIKKSKDPAMEKAIKGELTRTNLNPTARKNLERQLAEVGDQSQFEPTWRDAQVHLSNINSEIAAANPLIGTGVAGSASAQSPKLIGAKKALLADMEAFAQSQGDDVARKFAEANRGWAEHKELYGKKSVVPELAKTADEDVVDAVLRKGDYTGFEQLRKTGANVKGVQDELTDRVLGKRDAPFDPITAKKNIDAYGDSLNHILGREKADILRAGVAKGQGITPPINHPVVQDIIKEGRPESVYGIIVKHGADDAADALTANNLMAVRKMGGEDAFEKVRSRWIKDLFTEEGSQGVSPLSFSKKYGETGAKTRAMMLPKEMQQAFSDVHNLSRKAATAQRAYTTGSESVVDSIMATAAPAQQSALTFFAIKFMLSNLDVAAGTALTALGMQKLLTSPGGRAMLKEAFHVKYNTPEGAKMLGRLAAITEIRQLKED